MNVQSISQKERSFAMTDHRRREDRIVLVTGATAGIGRFLALDLATRGYRVFATGRDARLLATLADEAASRSLPLSVFELDVTSAPSIARLSSWIDAQTRGLGVDVVV